MLNAVWLICCLSPYWDAHGAAGVGRWKQTGAWVALQTVTRVHSDGFNITDNVVMLFRILHIVAHVTLTLDFLILLVSRGNKLWKRHS